MARAITLKNQLPAYAAETVERVEALGFGWKFIEEAGLAEPGKRIQVRDIAQLAPPYEVARYTQALQRGDQMPPVIQTRDRYLVDGHTRTEAARRLRWTEFPAVQVDVIYEQAPEPMRNQLLKLGMGFNNTHGRGMTPANIRALIEQIAAESDRPRDLAREMHLPESMVNTVTNAVKAMTRASRLGVTLIPGALTNSHLKILGQKSDKYTGPVFAELISLTQDARLSTTATTDLARRVEAVETESGRLTLLTAERASLRTVISGYHRDPDAKRNSPSKAGKLRQHLGFVVNNDPTLLTEMDTREAAKHLRVLTDARDQLDKVIAEQMAVQRARS
jgi:hypothetical protein